MNGVNPLLEFDRQTYTFTLYSVMTEHSGCGYLQPVNVAFALKKDKELGIDPE
jgi:hypothetical protein